MDNSKRETPPDRPDRALGPWHLMERLKRYKRYVPKNTGEDAGPVHDLSSHGSDAWGALAEIVDRIRNDNEMPTVTLPAFANVEPSMGVLG